jgi:pimeloyl-ACP methyl ester carboxylesterase
VPRASEARVRDQALPAQREGQGTRALHQEGTAARVMTPELIQAPDGRLIEAFVGGPSDGVPLILCHGTPSCGMLFRGWVEACASLGVCLIGYSRPGYGRSDRLEGRAVSDCVTDVDAVARVLELDRFYVLGHSGGGAPALACAALMPDRVLAAATVAGAAPSSAEGLDWLAGQEEENVQEWEAALAGGETLRVLLEDWAAEMLSEDEGEAESLGSLVSDADRASITPETSAFAAARRAHTLSGGIWGWFDDDIAETKPWGFDVGQIRVPVSVWHGGHDQFVPPAHGEWLAGAIPGARARFRPDEGHFSLIDTKFHELAEDLLASAR